jgi:membrane associated rhomboid family serine protease
MISSIWDDLRREYEYGNMISRLIIINVSIFFIYNFAYFIIYVLSQGNAMAFDGFMHYFCMTSDWRTLLLQPWSIFTHFFLHFGIGHILWNMVALYVFGSIFGDLLGDQRILPLYILGGLAGALAYFCSAMFLPNIGSYALGASASIMAIVVAAGVKVPNYQIRLILIGDVKLKYIVMVMVLLDMIGVRSMGESGGHIAHLGGAVMGFIFINRLNEGYDMSVFVNRILDGIVNLYKRMRGEARPKPKVVHRNREETNVRRTRTERTSNTTNQEELDTILEKIKQKGYDSLSKEEKEALFNASK